MSDNTTTLTIQHSELGVCHEVPVKDLVRATPALLLSHLQRQGALPPDDPSRPYVMLAEGRTLVPTQSLDAQGVGERSVVTLITRGTGAAPTASKERRVLDFETTRSPSSGWPSKLSGTGSASRRALPHSPQLGS